MAGNKPIASGHKPLPTLVHLHEDAARTEPAG